MPTAVSIRTMHTIAACKAIENLANSYRRVVTSIMTVIATIQ
jgi:hypothetical protein